LITPAFGHLEDWLILWLDRDQEINSISRFEIDDLNLLLILWLFCYKNKLNYKYKQYKLNAEALNKIETPLYLCYFFLVFDTFNSPFNTTQFFVKFMVL
ncbi:hypothetical protein ACJX0J_023642, partial [Zea mays]